jgi:hypothetical protein
VISGHAIYVTLAWAALAMALAVAAAVSLARTVLAARPGALIPAAASTRYPRPAVTKIMLVLGIWPL